jgi:hypothetical protein
MVDRGRRVLGCGGRWPMRSTVELRGLVIKAFLDCRGRGTGLNRRAPDPFLCSAPSPTLCRVALTSDGCRLQCPPAWFVARRLFWSEWATTAMSLVTGPGALIGWAPVATPDVLSCCRAVLLHRCSAPFHRLPDRRCDVGCDACVSVCLSEVPGGGVSPVAICFPADEPTKTMRPRP